MPDFSYENIAYNKGYKFVCGVDEAGRGPLAGPVCAAAVILPKDIIIEGLNDSKKLSEKKREELFSQITEKAIAYSVAFGSISEIEKYNILEATFIAMKRAVMSLSQKPDYCLIDGNREPKNLGVPCETIVKGDFKSSSIAAASILAKVSRDRLLLQYDKELPVYQFAKHKGYGTKLHYEMIKQYGVSKYHRPSFLKSFFDKEKL
ncbi:MAG: ribonuclease HII [Clostridia bacterium]|nr:ribonuclease HII [Clostridia bacterium]